MYETNEVIEFAKRYSLLYKEQKEMIEYGDFEGSIDEYALKLGYSAPASTLFRNRCKQLERLGILEITGNTKIKKFHIKSDLINALLNAPVCEFSFSNNSKEKKNADRRKEYVEKKRIARQKKNKSNEKKKEILELHVKGESQSSIARKMNVSRQYVNQIVKNDKDL